MELNLLILPAIFLFSLLGCEKELTNTTPLTGKETGTDTVVRDCREHICVLVEKIIMSATWKACSHLKMEGILKPVIIK